MSFHLFRPSTRTTRPSTDIHVYLLQLQIGFLAKQAANPDQVYFERNKLAFKVKKKTRPLFFYVVEVLQSRMRPFVSCIFPGRTA